MSLDLNSSWRQLLLGACALMLTACGGAERPQSPIILAASSLQEALTEVAQAFAEQGHEIPSLSFASSASLARQIEYGAPADLFISADQQWMDAVEQGGFVLNGQKADLLTNEIVLIAPIGGGAATDGDITEIIGDARIAIAEPESVPAGRYAKDVLTGLGAWDQLEAQMVPTQNVRAALALVERGEAEFGLVYASDALASSRVTIVRKFAAQVQPQIIYPLAILEAGPSPIKAELFAFLTSDEAHQIFVAHGFGIAR